MKSAQNQVFKIAYIMSRFPKISETFILYEILALQKRGILVEVYPLLKARQPVVHPEAVKLMSHVHYFPFFSLKILFAQLYFLLKQPAAYIKVMWEVLSATFGSLNFFIGAIGIFPKTVRFAYEMKKIGFDHIHAHFVNHPAVAALIIKRLTGIPYSFTAHGTDLHVDQRMLDKKVEAAKFAVTISSYNKEFMIKNKCGENSREKIKIVRCGIDPDIFLPRLGKKLNHKFQIICVASFELRVKGHAYLIKACKILKERGLEFQCHFVGDGPLRGEIEEMIANEKLKNEIVLHGSLERKNVAALLRESDVFVLPSVPLKRGDREGIPVAIMEAMAVGLPVVSSRISGIPELVESEKTGLLVEPRDVTGLADALNRLYENTELCEKMGNAGRIKVLNEYHLHKNLEKLIDLFLGITHTKNGEIVKIDKQQISL